jgi:hypothetical protein
MKWKYVISGFVIFMIILALFTNPNKESYMQFWENKFGEELSLVGEDGGFIQYFEVDKEGNIPYKVEKINFYIFSTYTAMAYTEYGVTHLGVFGHFIQISKGQFDYPWWLNVFTK